MIPSTDQNLDYLKLHMHNMTEKLLDLNAEKDTTDYLLPNKGCTYHCDFD